MPPVVPALDFVPVWTLILGLGVFMYVMLDGFDLGVGALHRLLARSSEEREQAIEAIGPV